MDPYTQWIYADAPKFGIDPYAADAISRGVEWPSRQGAGDAGTSFGPFQLHQGGALPSGRGKKWAESRAGVDYALRQMARAGARGLRGRQAIASISRNFEKPQDVAGEISKATAFFDAHSRQHANPRQAAIASLASRAGHKIGMAAQQQASSNQAKGALINYLLSNVQQYTKTGEAFNPQGLANLMLAQPVDMARHEATGKQIPVVAEKGAHLGGRIDKNAQVMIQRAKEFLGTPYKWGGASPKTGFDCSGFVQWLYGKAGVKVGRTTYDQVKQGKAVGRKGLKAGDVIFFSKAGDVHHEALYIGNGKFIHAPHTGDVIKISSLSDPYYSKQFAGGRRFL